MSDWVEDGDPCLHKLQMVAPAYAGLQLKPQVCSRSCAAQTIGSGLPASVICRRGFLIITEGRGTFKTGVF
jgi:hypothetical protein